jgi:drug/metabolite transporter (DMT)-like permease
MLAPVLLMVGLSGMPATGASLLLNAEGVFTALIAWLVFRENVDRKVAAGMALIVAGAVVLSWPGQGAEFAGGWPTAAVLGACLLWAVDNNLTRRVSFADATWLAMVKGLVAGSANLALAVVVRGQEPPAAAVAAAAMVVGFAAYGASLALFVVGLRGLGTARTGAYFSVAPFFGAALAVGLLGEPLTPRLLVAGALMGVGVWLHLTETHRHRHSHAGLVHEHPYDPADPHHAGVSVVDGDGSGTRHRHPPVTHEHPHYPDIHHRHDH